MTPEAQKEKEIKMRISRMIPCGPEGSVLRKLIFSHSIVEWEDVEKEIRKQFPEEYPGRI